MSQVTRSSIRRRLVAAAGVLALSVTSAACGSTVQVGDEQALASGALGAPGDPLTGVPGIDPVTGEPVDPGSGAVGGLGGSGSTPGSTASGSTGGTTGSTPTAGGASATPTSPIPNGTGPVKVGLMYLTGVDQTATAIGLSGLSTGDTRAQATAITKHINANGGLSGQTLELVLAPINSQDFANNRSQALEAACAQLTQDEKVRFIITFLQLTPGVMSCFAKGGASVIDDASALPDSVMAQFANNFVAPGDIAPGRMLTTLVDSLVRTGWLTDDSIIGSLSYDDEASVSLVEGALTSALAKHGMEIEERQQISNDSNGVSQSSAAVLRYKSAGVDRIIPVNSNPLFVMQAASNQGYRPDYALYSLFGPGAFMEASAPRDQLQGAAGIGWSPYLDIGSGKRPGPVSPNETLCFQIMQENGQAANGNTTRAFQLQLCNSFFYLQYAAEKVGGAPVDLFGRARPVVGTTFAPADTFDSNVTKRVDGVAAYRELTFVDGCACFQYGAQRATG